MRHVDIHNRTGTVHLPETADVIYFFSKGTDYMQCELHPGQPHLLTLIAPDGAAQSERYSTSADLTERWQELTNGMAEDGWAGPFGRDPRS